MASAFAIDTYAFDLMPNHFHIILETPTGEISRFLQRFLTRAVQYLNRRHHRVGHLLQGRTKTLLIEKDRYFSTVMAYVLLNRVRAGLARDIFSDEYNSVGDMLSLGESRLSRSKLWEYLFGHAFDERRKRSEVARCRKWLASLDNQETQRRFAEGHRGSFLGSKMFRGHVLKRRERRLAVPGNGHRRKSDRRQANWTWTEIVTTCRKAIEGGEWRVLWRNLETAIRHLSWYVAMDGCGWTYERIRCMQRDSGTPPSRYTMAVSRIRTSASKRRIAETIMEQLNSPIFQSGKVAE